MQLRRLATIALSIAMLCASIPAPVYATSTAQEVEIGKETDKQITDSTNVITDPLLNAWVNDVTQRLWAQVARKDVPYNIKILDDPTPNAFSTLGGYVYADMGIIDFVQSDDELAGVLGHETGHIERRHAIETNNRANILNILLGVGSLFSPFLYHFGNLMEAGAIAKMQRTDEIEADRYGLRLMSRAGYDPEAMVSMMKHLASLIGDPTGLLNKYLADHPDFPNRVAHLSGYPELDPTVRTDDQRLAAAIHNVETARYSIAAMQFSALLKSHPEDTVAAYHLGEAQIALGQTAKGEQNLSIAAEKGTGPTRTLALGRIHALRDTEKRLDLLHANIQPLRDMLVTARTGEAQAATAISARRDAGRDQVKLITSRLENIEYELPTYLGALRPRPGSRAEAVLHNLTTIGRSLNTALQDSQTAISGVGSLEHNKTAGLLRDNAMIYDELEAPLKLTAPPPQALATFSYYPRMLGELQNADGDMVRAVDAARGSLALLDVALGDLDKFIRQLAHTQIGFNGDYNANDYKILEPLMAAAVGSLNKAAVGASQAQQLFELARARQLETRITMLGLAESPDRFATLQHAIDLRFHNAAFDYDAMLKNDLSPGEVTAASIIAADTNSTPQVVVDEAKASNKSLIDIANGRGMYGESLEIFLGLVYLDYADDPEKEAHNPNVPGPLTPSVTTQG
jgi:Zn-dependent protease with chaperone function